MTNEERIIALLESINAELIALRTVSTMSTAIYVDGDKITRNVERALNTRMARA